MIERMGLGVSVRLARLILATTRVHGADAAAVAAAAGLDLAVLDGADARLPLKVEEALWREASRATGIDAIGLAAAELVQPGMFDVLDYAVRSSTDVEDALARLIRLNRLEHDAATFVVTRRGDGTVRLAHTFHGSGAPGRHLTEFTLAGLLVAARQCTEQPVVAREVHLRSARPADLAPYARVFGETVRFEQEEGALIVEEAVLALPFKRADSALCAILERHAEALLGALPPLESSLSDRVRTLITAQLRGGDPSVGAIADGLHMSDRTLQRKLAAEGASFDEIVDGLRAELARRYLEDPRLAIGEVAFLLGYSEASAFHRAFKRWTGRTPGDHRRDAGLQGDGTMARTAPAGSDVRRRKR
jgi:AraC-like DNA-binding protein